VKVSGWAIVALLAVSGGLWLRGEVWQGRAVANALALDSTQAMADYTRRVYQGDHVRQERRIVQAKLSRDSVDKQLKRTTTLLARLTAQVKPIDTVLVSQVTEDNNVRQARFQTHTPPYTIEATAVLPPPPQQADLNLRIRLDPARLVMRSQCGQPVRGIRPATLMITGPQWLTFTVDSAQQEPLFCNSQIAKQMHGGGYYAVRGAGLAAVLAFLGSVVF
jgi:hypothetical protein